MRPGVTVALVALAVALVPSTAQAHTRACPQFTVTVSGERSIENLTVTRGPVSCRDAEKVAHDFAAGRGIEHGTGPEANRSWTVDGWTCGHGAGGGACRSGRSALEYSIAGYWEYHDAA
jgi:hypothetical protein